MRSRKNMKIEKNYNVSFLEKPFEASLGQVKNSVLEFYSDRLKVLKFFKERGFKPCIDHRINYERGETMSYRSPKGEEVILRFYDTKFTFFAHLRSSQEGLFYEFENSFPFVNEFSSFTPGSLIFERDVSQNTTFL